MNVIQKLSNNLKETSTIDYHISKFILDNMDDLSKINIKTIATQCFSSSSTVTRFSKKIGFEGFSELKYKLKEELNSLRNMKDVLNVNNFETILEDKMAEILISMEKQKEISSIIKINEFISRLDNAEIIYIVAQGGSYVVAYDFALRLRRFSYRAMAISDPVAQKSIAKVATENDLFIFISYSGETKNLLTLMDYLEEQKIQFISMTKESNNSIKRRSSYNVEVLDDDSEMNKILNNSRLYFILLVDLILLCIIYKKGINPIKLQNI